MSAMNLPVRSVVVIDNVQDCVHHLGIIDPAVRFIGLFAVHVKANIRGRSMIFKGGYMLKFVGQRNGIWGCSH